jgi:hypothetical protein
MDFYRTLKVVKQDFIKYLSTNEILELLETTLRINNDFTFCDIVFLKIFGIAMGKPFSASYDRGPLLGEMRQ